MRAVVAVLLLVAAGHAALWGFFQEKQQAPDFRGILPSISYAPFEPGHNTVADPAADSEKIRDDLRKFSTITRAVRLYTSTEGSELVPPIAAEFGVKVMVGTWISRDTNRNDREIDAAIDLARRNSNVIGVIVGNETIYRGEQIPIDNLLPVSEREPGSDEFKRILAEEAQRTNDAETQPEEKRSLALKWANDENDVHRLIRLIQRVKKSVNVPVTTGEI